MSKVPQRPRAARRFLPAVLIVGAVLLAYAPVRRAGFIWDNGIFLTKNPLIYASDGLYRFWFTTAPPDYFPLTSSMLWFEWRLWGTNATGYHVVNVLLHAASAVLLWRVLLRLRVPGAWLAGLLFALHPVAVQSVAWITERKNTLPMLLYLASILAYLRFEDIPALVSSHHDNTTNDIRQSAIGNRQYSLSLGLFLLALLAKTSVVMLPAVLLLLAWWRRGKVGRQDLLRTVPFFALSLALGLVTVWFQWHNVIGNAQAVVRPEGAASRIAAAGWIVWFYLYKILLPAGLCPIYSRWAVVGSSLLSYVPLALLAAATGLLWVRRKRWGAGPLVAWAYFAVSLLPVLGFVSMSFMQHSLVADHLQYVAMPGILALAAALMARAMAGDSAGRPATVVVGICLAAMAALTFQRACVFTSDQRLWRDNVEKTPRSARAWYDLGMTYVNASTLDEAFRCFDKVLELDPQYVAAWLGRGAAHSAANRYDEAIRDYDQAIALKPDYADAWFCRGTAYAQTGHAEEAMRDLNQAIALKPSIAEAYINRGSLHAAAHRYAEAIREYDLAIALKPYSAAAYLDRAIAYYMMKEYPRALSDVRAAQCLGGQPRPDFLRDLVEAAGRSD